MIFQERLARIMVKWIRKNNEPFDTVKITD